LCGKDVVITILSASLIVTLGDLGLLPTSFTSGVATGRRMDPSSVNFIPTDIFYMILEHLADRRDLHAAALTNWDFNRAATPLLYRTLDTDTRPRLPGWGHKSVRLLQLLLDLRIVPNHRY